MSTTAFVTTFSSDHISLYGKHFIDTFTMYNSHLPLFVYAEDFSKAEINGNYNLIDFKTAIPEHKEFYNHIDNLKKGLLTKPTNRLKKALRWSYKSFVTIHALKNLDYKYIVWIDADVETLSTLPESFIATTNGKNLITIYLQKIDNTPHVESGFVIFNKHHTDINHLIDHYINGYHNKKILELQKPWDGFWLANFCTSTSAPVNIINPPFSNLRKLFKHNVGKDKFRDTDLNKFSGRKS